MKFGDFQLFTYLIWLVPVLALFYAWAMKRETRTIEKFAQKELLSGIAPFYDAKLRKMWVVFNITAVLFMIIALSRPQWGFYWKEDERKGLDVVIAVDTSRSMLAVDIQPNRLSFAKTELKDFVRRLKGDRVGLIAFSGQAFLQCPLTADYNGFLLTLNDLSTETIPTGGTSISSAIEEAIRSYKGAATRHRVMIIITDGETTEAGTEKAVERARKEGITISCIGIGTPKGDFIPYLDEKGQKVYVKDAKGNRVKSRLMESTLQMIAEKTGGIYVRASQADFGLREIYEKRLSKLEKKKTEEKKVKVYKERYQYPLAVVLLLFFGELVLKARKREA
ncbi:MAG: VWA domain-containing protein [Candidatus Omnitrophica bacterium]|nr:VWA domain-containing protein [Candidatus Omnitrophota bacterium]